MPPDFKMTDVSRTVGENRLVDEMVIAFTHSIEMPWILPGLAPTGRYVEVPLVAIVGFRDGKLAHENIYRDQASVLKQIGLLKATASPPMERRQPTTCLSFKAKKTWLKEETHAARWGLLRGYSGKATKWVDFVMTDSTRRESCHSLKVTAKRIGVKRHLWIALYRSNYWCNCG
jgi:hypothetical protein